MIYEAEYIRKGNKHVKIWPSLTVLSICINIKNKYFWRFSIL